MGRRGAGGRGSSRGARALPSQGQAQGQSQYQGQYQGQGPGQAQGQGRKPQGRGATYSVAVMTIAALVGVGILAAQAAATAPSVSTAGKSPTQTATSPSAGAGSSATAAPNPNALPANSGSGLRIVYSLAAKRVWLVSASNAVARTFQIVPGTIPAPTGTFSVNNRQSSTNGSDGTPVQYVVLFNRVKYNGSSASVGFDAVANVTGLPPAPSGHTGGIRMAQADAQALWSFSTYGTKVVVVP